MEGFLNKAIELLTTAGGKILFALLAYIIGKAVVKKIVSIFEKGKALDKLDPTTKSFLLNFIKVLLYVVLVVSIIGILGIPMASIVTVLATAGIAVGAALQGSLGNLAGGIMLMIFRPFNVGNFVTAAGETGTVKAITLFYTKLTTLDNKEITIPNGSLMNSNVTNFSTEPLRRVDIDFTCARGEDVGKIRAILSAIQAEDPRILKDPAPFARLTGATNESMVFTTRSWVNNADYWDVFMDTTQKVTEAFGAAGIKAPGIRVVTEQKSQWN